MNSSFLLLVLSLITLTQGRVSLTNKKCPVLYKGICYVVLEADHIFVRQTAEEDCEAKYGKDKGAHLADIVDKTLFKELVEYVEKLRYITDAFVLTGMEYYDQKAHYFNGKVFNGLYWGPPPVRPITIKKNRNICLRVSRTSGKTKLQNIGEASETYHRALCQYTGK